MTTFTDADGTWPVVEWRVYYPDDALYCSLIDEIDELPREGVQAIAWFIEKDDTIRCHIVSGIAADPSIYHIGDRELIGTMLPDEEYVRLEQQIFDDCADRVRELRTSHG